MDVSAWMRACVNANVSGRKTFFFEFLIHCDSALWCIVEKKQTNKLLGLKKLDSCSF